MIVYAPTSLSEFDINVGTNSRAAKLEDEVHSRALKRQMEHHNLKMSMAEAEMGREVERLAKMKELGVDLTK